jgi:hypothetical protein
MLETEKLMKKKGQFMINNNKEFNALRAKFIQRICEINSVANVQGKGRDDLTIDILLKAEELSKKIS